MKFFEFLANLKFVWMRELENKELQTISPDFLSQAQSLLSDLQKSPTDMDEVHKKVYSLCSKILRWAINDVRFIRRLKIFSIILSREKIEEINGNLLREEEILIEALTEALKSLGGEVETIRDPLLTIRVDIDIHRKAERKLILLQTTLKDLVGSDGLIYRGLREKTIANIPQKNFELLVERNVKVKSLS